MSSSLRKRLLLGLSLAAVGALSMAGTASAITLGAVAPPDLGGCSSCDVFGTKNGVGAPKYTVPQGPTGLWTITSWSAQGGGSQPGQARLRVYRRTSTSGQYMLLRQSKLETVPPHGHPSFATSMRVNKGDLLGLGTIENVPSAYGSAFTDSTVKALICDPTGPFELVGAGTSCPLGTLKPEQVNVSATLTPR
jgi:hypothetical protein